MDRQVDPPSDEFAPSLDLNWKVGAVCQPVDDSVKSVVEQRQEDMEHAVRLLDQFSPHRELDCLTKLFRVWSGLRRRDNSGYQVGVNSSPVS